MTAPERLTAFKQALTVASEQFGVRLAIVQQLGDIFLDEPTLAYVLIDTVSGLTNDLPKASVSLSQELVTASPSPLAGRGSGGGVE